MESTHQQKRQARAGRIVNNVGGRQRAIRERWAPMIAFHEAQIAHLEELARDFANLAPEEQAKLKAEFQA